MKLENQVCSLQQSQQLEKLGIAQKSHFAWYEVSNGDDEGDFEKEGVVWVPVLTQYDYSTGGMAIIGAIDDELMTSSSEFCSHKPPYSAFTVAELGAMAECCISGKTNRGTYYATPDEYAPYDLDSAIGDVEPLPEPLPWYVERQKQAVALADLLIWMVENNLLTAEDCNERLLKV